MRWLLALLAVGAPVLAGCGGSPSYVHDEDGVVRVTLDEYRVVPDHIEVPSGTVHLLAVNRGRLTHNLAIEQWDSKPGVEPKLYGRTDTLQPGATGHDQHAIHLRPGTYRILCTLSGHDDLGQYGELKVVAR